MTPHAEPLLDLGPREDWETRRRPAPWDAPRASQGVWHFRLVGAGVEAAELGWSRDDRPRGHHFTLDASTLTVGVHEDEEGWDYDGDTALEREIPVEVLRRAMGLL